MTKIAEYQDTLQKLTNWDEYLLQEFGLPGPRGAFKLAQAVANEGDRDIFCVIYPIRGYRSSKHALRVSCLLWCGWIWETARRRLTELIADLAKPCCGPSLADAGDVANGAPETG